MSRGTLDTAVYALLLLTGLSPSLAALPKAFLLGLHNHVRGPNPEVLALRFGLFPFRSPLLRKSFFIFSSSGYLDVSVHRVPFHNLLEIALLFTYGYAGVACVGCPIQISAGRWIFAPYRSFSQLITSFIGSQCQGIRLMLFVA